MKKILYTLIILMAISAIVSGLMMVTHPDGGSLGLPLSLLEPTSFPDYFFPGVLLILVIGFPHLVSIYYLGRKHKKQYIFSMFAGMALVSWIIVQVILIHSANWLHYTCLGAGILEVLISVQLRGKWVV